MFFTQGLLVSVFSSLVAGGSVVCTPKYEPQEFFACLDEFKPTWYAAPTAVQRSILNYAPNFTDAISRSCLRVIRCTSAAASADLIDRLEALFDAPVLDTYGLTEASSTIVGQRLPPAIRKPGSVGQPIGCEVAIIDEHGGPLGTGLVGEVIVRGPGVIHAYDGDPAVNEQSFVNGWLRTGDLGLFDQDGFLFLHGRKKEIINRGGMKILPGEIDEVLNSHPAVAEGLAYALPNERLGEDVAVAVILRNGWQPSEELRRELRQYCATRLSLAKVPGKIVFVKDLPKTATGKIMRIGLAEKLDSQQMTWVESSAQAAPPPANGDEAAPQGIMEMVMVSIWEEALDRRPIGVRDDFFALGGDSLHGARLLARVRDVLGVELEPAFLLAAPTPADMVAALARSGVDRKAFEGSKVIAIRSSGSLPPLFILGAQPLFRALILNLPTDVPVFAVGPPDLTRLSSPVRLEEIAALQVEAIRRFRPFGPYALMGWCVDGVLAYEMARQLRAQRQEVSLLAMIDAFNPAYRKAENHWKGRWDRLKFHAANLSHLNAQNQAAYLAERWNTVKTRSRQQRAIHALRKDCGNGSEPRALDPALHDAVAGYVPEPYPGSVMVVRPTNRPAGTYWDAELGWQGLVAGISVVDVPGNHRDVFTAPNVAVMASAFTRTLSIPREESLEHHQCASAGCPSI
jgi:thioesterase domain-containing protein